MVSFAIYILSDLKEQNVAQFVKTFNIVLSCQPNNIIFFILLIIA